MKQGNKEEFKPDVKLLLRIKRKKNHTTPRFTKEEKSKIDQLIATGYVNLEWTDDNKAKSPQELVLTNKGEVYLFIDNNQENVNEFKGELQKDGFDDALMEAYLEYMFYHNRDISLTSDLRVNSFKLWGSIQEIDIHKSKAYN